MARSRLTRSVVVGTVLAVLGFCPSCENIGGLLGEATIRILSPTGGETWVSGDPGHVEWLYSGTGQVHILLSRDGNWVDGDGSDVFHLGTRTTPAGWNVMTPYVDGPSSPNCRVRALENLVGYDVSNAFVVRGPVNASVPWVDPGGTVDFTLSASDTAALAFQWRRDGVNIPGATSPSYTTPPAALADDGALFTCLVTHPWGTTETVPGMLSIRRFSDIGAGLPGVSGGSLAWGDYDGDGDPDLATAGYNGTDYRCRIFGNTAGAFADILAGLPDGTNDAGVSVAWGDYDGDGDVDLALSGECTSGPGGIFDNDAGAFMHTGSPVLGPVNGSCLAWGDYDNDGDLDLVWARYSFGEDHSPIYRNDGGTFTAVDVGLPLLSRGSLEWGDYDNDGDLDLALSGLTPSGATFHRITRVYRNDAGYFVDTNSNLPGVDCCAIAWCDYDNDGDLDLAAAGDATDYASVSRIWRNDQGRFTDINAGLPGVAWGALAWGDYDDDGDSDLVLGGMCSGDPVDYRLCRLYRNDGGRFVRPGVEVPGVWCDSAVWGDYDGDGDLDLALGGSGDPPFDRICRIYGNEGIAPANTPPGEIATGLSASASGIGPTYEVTFFWDDAVDAQTPSAGLSYNLRVGTSSGANDVRPGTADASGRRLVFARGQIQPGLSMNSHTLHLPAGTYYWSVQAVDTCFAGGPWSAEGTVNVP
ncbi:MAG: FG-GAP-like repeat-containing protein [Planctomycetota bacterium]|jgi:hypothetical protein